MQECRMPFHRPPAPASGAAPGTDASAMETLYRAALGPVQQPRYLALFERFDRAGRAPAGWNPAAALATLNWMLLHHLWSAALVYVALVEGLALLVFGIGRPLLRWPEQVEWGLFAAFALFAIVLPGLFGDALLHRELRKRIAHALVAAHSMPEAHTLLARQASSWRRLGWIAAGNLLLFATLALAWALVPQGGWSDPAPSNAQRAIGAVQPGAVQPGAVPQRAQPGPEPSDTTLPAPSARASAAAGVALPASAAAGASAQPAAVQNTPPPAPPLLAQNNALARPAAGAARTPASSPASAAMPRAEPASVAVPTPTKASTAPAEAAREPQADTAPASPAAKTPRAKAPPRTATPPAAAPTPAQRGVAPAARASAPAAAASAPLGSAPGYYLNVGLFADEANARRAQAKLLNANLPAFRQSFSTSAGQRTRVRVGPFPTAAEAQKAAQQIRRLQLEAVMYQQRG